MMEKQRFSFIIPVMNGEKYIRQCLETIKCEMNSANDEIIVVDNGSTDNTISILEEFNDVRVVRLPNITIAAMRNAGAKLASGDFLAFIDSDCTLSAGWRNAVLEVFKDENVGATGSHYDIPETSNWIVKAWCSNRHKSKSIVKWINTCNLIVRQAVFGNINGFDEKLKTDEDFDIGLRICESGFLIIEDPRIRIVHHKNPDSIEKFYRRERWYATSMLSSVGRKRVDKPLVMTLIFMISLVAIFISIPIAFQHSIYLVLSSLLMLAVLAATALNRAFKYRNFQVLPQLGCLFVIYYSARSMTVLEEIAGKVGIISRLSRK
jgi:glycosyltransferase involved in cell wall biosynthesis